ncbi:CaiB/BaiF CoA-transferase family protein [Pseudovibrio sp. SPO723]|uniref:CaiB/BaiF CoA transferase family protein n=1 Tax=Nesiotobacter zosterae TaxID=392721 RepID=UPI0029C288AF|nr:CaiB/BaiF CoA-transferase family protein [Pseudovibrio sp. SPO723]MDX5593536.1 CaiB/BaiF CoA-transferase family protein [Pseudovibrio sp. SPO723]
MSKLAAQGAGPLAGVRVVEIAGLGPTPYAAMILADMGAEVTRIERPGATHLVPQSPDFLNRSRDFVELDLKEPEALHLAKELIAKADVLIEGLRPGVMEKNGLGPEVALALNPRIIYGRMTGWGQSGPLAKTAGHDINYIALTGALHAIGSEDAPTVPLNLLGDFGGGSLFLVTGILAALFHAARTGEGQVVDAAITDGTLHLLTLQHSLMHSGLWRDRRATNILDGTAPFYTTYECADGEYIAVGCLEPHFYALFIEGLGLDINELPPQMNSKEWPKLRQHFAQRIKAHSRDHWERVFAGTDACVTPVLSLTEAKAHPHNKERRAFAEIDDIEQPAPAPRLSKTQSSIRGNAPEQPVSAEKVLARWSQPPAASTMSARTMSAD